jgi:2-polyprenyl-6-methoxyphenol hydroxylase-like FAD-dependent oxidoreductase
MPAVRRVLVVGAGVGGCAVAALLAEAGVEVQLVEQKSELAGIGSGISLQGNAMRVLRQIGVWDEVRDNGYAFDSLAFRAPDEHGSLVAEVQDARTGGPDLPAGLGIYRATLADILARRVRQLGGQIRFSASPTKLMDHRDEVEVAFQDGSIEGYDLVIGADGVNSAVRRLMGIELSPRSSGIGVWRVFVPRPAGVTRTELYYGGPSNLAGYTPTGQDWMYAFISEPATDRSAMTQQEQLALMRELATAYHGPWDDIRASMTGGCQIVCVRRLAGRTERIDSYVYDG